MPITGQGIIPSGAIANELTALTRRAFIPKMVVQIYKSTPLFGSLLANAHTTMGGIDPITVPVQGNPYVDFAWAGYSGSFNQPSVQAGAYNAQFTQSLGIIPIPFLGMEGLVQMDQSVIPIIDARMNDAGNVARDAMATALYTNSTNMQQLVGLPAAIDDGTNVVTYGGLSRTTYPWWQSYYVHNGAAVSPTRDLMNQYINGLVKHSGGEMPTYGLMGFGTWTKLTQDFTAMERYNVGGAGGSYNSGGEAKSLFRALQVAGIPIYPDPYCPEGDLWLMNDNYSGLYIHHGAKFAFTGFTSALPNSQLGYIGAIVIVLQFVNVKPKSHGHIDGLSYIAI